MLLRALTFFAFTGLAVLSCTGPVRAAEPVTFFSPQGEVKAVRQVTARFASAIVPFGDPRELDPFTIDCVEKGHGRWADGKNWIYDFDRDLPAGVRCGFSLKSGVAALDGTILPTGQRFEFNTGGPAILRSLPWEGSRIDENQIFILGLDAPARAETITAGAHCVAAGIHERIGVRMVTGDERKIVLDNRKSFATTYLRALLLDDESGRARSVTFRLPVTGSDEDKFIRLRDAPDSPLVTLACARTLPADAEVKLVWGKGIASASGIATAADQGIAFQVRPTFRASFSCQRVNKDAQCMPILPLTLGFTAPIAARDAARIHLVDVGGRTYAAKLPKRDGGDAAIDAVESVDFGPGLPENHTFRIELPAGLKDDAGRPLSNSSSFPLRVKTDENPPLAKFTATFGILEAALPDKSTPLLPVTVRNVESAVATSIGTLGRAQATSGDGSIAGQLARINPGDEMQIVEWFGRIEAGERVEREYDEEEDRWTVKFDGHARSIFTSKDQRQAIAVPKPGGAKAFEVIGIPLAAPGFYVMELASPRLGAALFGERKPYYVRTTTLVTNLGVHFKRGRESSLVWVTRLADGKPMPNAQVSVRDCAGKTYWQGRSDKEGIARVDSELPELESLPRCGRNYRKAYFVTARAGADTAFVFSDWNEGISPWRFNVPTGNDRGAYVAHAVLDRSLFRAGDTASMKIFVRKLVGQGFALPPRPALEDTLTIRHQGSDRKYSVPVTWDSAGAAADANATHGEAAFGIPKDADLGTYTISMRDSLGTSRAARQDRYIGSFRVEAFRVPLMRARLQATDTPLVNPAGVSFDVQVNYLAGAGAGGLPVKLRTQTETRSVTFPDFEDYAFAAGNVKEGREEQGDAYARFDGNTFADSDMGDDDESAMPSEPARQRGTELPLTLDAAGGMRAAVKDIGRSEQARDLVAELEYRDPNGETLTAATRTPVWPARVVLGIKPDSWVASKEKLKFTIAAVDTSGKPLTGVKVAADAFKRETYSHRRRLIGGFYAYEHGAETRRLGTLCSGETDAHGLLICDVAAPASGNLILRAQTTDEIGNLAVTRADAWVATGEDWWFAASDNDRVDVLPEQKRYEPNGVARLQVRMPFQEATALVTVEREGVLESFVRVIKRDNPVIEVPIKPEYAPNVFVSVFLVRGRIAGVAPTALIDLAKPSFKMGLAEIRVGWVAHELSVKLTPDKDAYKVRDHAKVMVSVRRADGSAPPRGAEVAIAAVDEGLLELLPNDSWKLLDAMMTRRGEEVETSTAQMQVIGKRHFGRKAIAAGGGGGRQSARELFDTLLLWRARVVLDDAGNAAVDVPLNDSLTSFRIVAVASSGAQLFGTGFISIRSTQDLMLLPGLPPLVREGDQFSATVTVRNASSRPMRVSVAPRVTAVGAEANTPPLAPQAIDLDAGQAREVAWNVAVPTNATRLDWQIDSSGQQGAATVGDPVAATRDTLKTSQTVVPAIPVRTFQATIFQLTAPQDVAVQRPVDAVAGRGGVNVSMQATLAGELPGVREYLSRYPYSCFEQQTSIAVGLRDTSRWDALMRTLPAYLDREGMVKYWPVLKDGDDSLTAYVLSVAAESGWEIPDDSRTRMENALIGFVEGRVVRFSALPTADLSIRKIAALEALSRRKEALNAKWLDSIAIEPNLWPTSAVIDWYWILKRSPKLPKRDARIEEAAQILRSRLNFQGTTMGFSTEKTDALWWLMVSADSNANKLLLALLDDPAWREDMPRLARGTLARLQHGHWNTTVANAWGALALEKFSAAFETHHRYWHDQRHTGAGECHARMGERRSRQGFRQAAALALAA